MAHNQDDPEFIADELTLLRQSLRGRYNHIDEHLLDGSIEDALLHYRAHPEQFDASRGVPLHFYLMSRARGYLSTKLRKEKRHWQHEQAAGVWEKDFEKITSEVRAGGPIYIGRDRSGRKEDEREEEQEIRRGILDAIVEQMNPRDRAGAQLLRAGASPEEWVRNLGIEHLPRKERQKKVNAEKDRMMKMLKRRAQKMPGGGSRWDGVRVRETCFFAEGEREAWLTQPRMSHIQRVDGSAGRKHSSASCSLLSACCCW